MRKVRVAVAEAFNYHDRMITYESHRFGKIYDQADQVQLTLKPVDKLGSEFGESLIYYWKFNLHFISSTRDIIGF